METGGGPVLVFDQVPVPGIDTQVPSDSKLKNKLIFASELASLWTSQKYMDVNLICTGNEVVRAHQLVLAGLSPFFRQIFLDVGPAAEIDHSILLEEVEADSLRDCLQKVYLGDAGIASLDSSLNHLCFTGEPLTQPIRSSDTVHGVVQGTIKSEPGFVADLIENVDDSSFVIIPTGGNNKKAKVWKHFIIKDKETATCLICQIDISTKRGCTSGMIKHIARNHPEEQDALVSAMTSVTALSTENDLEESDIAKEEPMDTDDPTYEPLPLSPIAEAEDDHLTNEEIVFAPRKGKKSKVWNFYTRLEKDSAKCKACDMTIKTQKGNTTGMTRHLFRNHLDLYTELESMKEKDIEITPEPSNNEDTDEDFSPFQGIRRKGTKRKKRAVKKKTPQVKKNQIWSFFDAQEDGLEARCHNCLIMVKTEGGNVSGLVSHLKSSHPEQYEELDTSKISDDKSAAAAAAVRNSPVWQFYEEIGSNRVKCLKCTTVLKYYYGTTSGLLRHLRRSHPEAYDTIKGEVAVPEGTPAAVEVDNETIWKFFTKDGPGKANCSDCMAEISIEHGTLVASCEEHLRAAHTDLLEQYETQRKAFVHELIKKDKTAVKRRYTSRVTASAIWTYFKKTEDNAMNTCSTCLLTIDCSQNSTAMVRHLEENHAEQYEAFKKQSGIEAKDVKKPSAIWKHFQVTDDPKKHKCMVRKMFIHTFGCVSLMTSLNM